MLQKRLTQLSFNADNDSSSFGKFFGGKDAKVLEERLVSLSQGIPKLDHDLLGLQ